jgi:hypothetical protein
MTPANLRRLTAALQDINHVAQKHAAAARECSAVYMALAPLAATLAVFIAGPEQAKAWAHQADDIIEAYGAQAEAWCREQWGHDEPPERSA